MVKAIIYATQQRHYRMQLEIDDIIKKSEDFTSSMLAKDHGLELGQVVRYSDELAIIEKFHLSISEPTGFKIEITSYLDPGKYAVVNLDSIRL